MCQLRSFRQLIRMSPAPLYMEVLGANPTGRRLRVDRMQKGLCIPSGLGRPLEGGGGGGRHSKGEEYLGYHA